MAFLEKMTGKDYASVCLCSVVVERNVALVVSESGDGVSLFSYRSLCPCRMVGGLYHNPRLVSNTEDDLVHSAPKVAFLYRIANHSLICVLVRSYEIHHPFCYRTAVVDMCQSRVVVRSCGLLRRLFRAVVMEKLYCEQNICRSPIVCHHDLAEVTLVSEEGLP